MTLRHQTHHHHRRVFTCHRHPTAKPITGFCASCLRERLSTIDSATATECTSPATNNSPRLRRTKSFSSSNNIKNVSASSSASEPRRKSCDVGPSNTLSNLFSLEDQKIPGKKPDPTSLTPQLKEEEEEEEEENEEGNVKISDEFMEEDGELKTMKEFIDLELESKKSTVSFWETASVFSKKLLKWKQKQQKKNSSRDDKASSGQPERDIESEIGLYGYIGRRSCDIDPRLSADNARYSFDEPRASWDGYLIGKACPKLITPMAAVEEKGMSGNEREKSPGGSEQTRDYYGDSLSWQRKRKSFDRSNSGKRNSSADVDEVKYISNAKVSPETVGLFHGAKLLVTEKELNDSNWYSIKEYSGNNVQSGSKNVGYVPPGVGQKGLNIKKKLLNMWGFKQKKNEAKSSNEEEKFTKGSETTNVVEKIKRVAAKVEMNGNVSEKLIRSYSVSARNSCKEDGLFHGGGEGRENCGFRRRDELLMQRNRGSSSSNVYSPNNLENGLLRFYLTPMRSYRRSKSGGNNNNRPRNSCSSLIASGL